MITAFGLYEEARYTVDPLDSGNGSNMGRVISISNPAQRRNSFRRTIAEILRHLMLKRELDEEAKDMAATVVFALRGIAETIETSTEAWEKRNYYLKADRFRRQWEWVPLFAARLQNVVVNDRWEQLPRELAMLAPYFQDVKITKLTRAPATWQASYRLLKQETLAKAGSR